MKLNPILLFQLTTERYFKELLSASKLGVINIHPSLLPYYRGPVPTAWAIINNEKEFGITIHQVDSGIDTGDILVQEKYDIHDDETGHDLYLRAMEKGAELLINNFDRIMNEEIKPKKQPSGGSYFGKLSTRVLIDWKEKASYQESSEG